MAYAYARYDIVQRNDHWMVKFNDEDHGPFADRPEALLFATRAAKKLSGYGRPAKVVWMGEMDDGLFHHEWTYGPSGHEASFAA
jgi:hypothetical protein